MATKPADPALTIPWAIDTNITSGPQAGETTKYAPSLSYIQQGCTPGRSAPGRYMNFLFNELYKSAKYVWDGLFSGAVASIDADVRAFADFEYCDATGAATTKPREKMIPLTNAMVSTGWAVDFSAGGGAVRYRLVDGSPGPTHRAMWEIVVPNGATATRVRAGVIQGAVGAGPSHMEMEVFQVAYDKAPSFAALTVTSLGTDVTTGAGGDLLAVNFSFTGSFNTSLFVSIKASDGALSDTIQFLDFSFNDPGPRNH